MNKKLSGKIISGMRNAAVIAIFTAIGLARTVMADNSVNITADKDVYEIGDKVSVTIEVVTDEDSATPPHMNIEYSPSRLNFENCSTEYGGGGGGLVTVTDTGAVVDFTTLSGGVAGIDVTATVGDNSVQVTGSLDITVNGEDTAMQEEVPIEEGFGVEASYIATNDGRQVQTVFANEFMPILFHKTTTQYQGQDTECAQFDMGDMILLYTTDAGGNDGKFCVYNTLTGELSDFRMIQGIENRFIIVLNDCDEAIPNGFTKAVLDWNGQTLTAYTSDNLPGDFFLIYALSSEGSKGWYQYDQREGTYQRFAYANASFAAPGNDGFASDIQSGSSDEETFLDDFLSRDVQMILLIVFFALTLILLIVVIILAVKCSEYNDYEYIDPEDYYADDDAYPAEEQQRTHREKAASIVMESLNDDEEEEAEEEPIEEEEPVMHKASAGLDKESEDSKDNIKKDVKVKHEEEEEPEEDETDESEEDEPEETEPDDVDDYFDPRLSKAEIREIKKQRKREAKEAAREEKWRLKEEKRAAKMRAKGYEEASPMDWSTFSESMGNDEDDRRPVGKSSLPAYMRNDRENNEVDEEESVDPNAYGGGEVEFVKTKSKLATKHSTSTATVSAQNEEETLKANKEDELRKKQKRLFEQQQLIEQQRRIEKEQYEEQQRLEQERYVLAQKKEDEDLDEDFHFEFLNL